MNKISRNISKHLIICFVVSIALTAVVLLATNPYRGSIITEKYTGNNTHYVYNDLDNDGFSERIEFHKYKENILSALIYKNERIVVQEDFNGEIASGAGFYIEDLNNDDTKEILVFTRYGDTLFLSCIYLQIPNIEFNLIPICNVYKVNDNYSFSVSIAGAKDINEDGMKDIFFTVRAGYATRPRCVFGYYPGLDTLYISPASCALISDCYLFDLDMDNIPEIFGRNQATGNCDFNQKFSDQFSWLMVFNPKMEFKFPPVNVGIYPSNTELIPYADKTDNKILAFHWYEGKEDIKDFLAFYNESGNKTLYRELTDEEDWRNSLLFSEDDSYSTIYLANPEGKIFQIQNNLESKLVAKLGNIHPIAPLFIDLDKDGKKEHIFISGTLDKLIICRYDFSNHIIIDFPRNLEFLNISCNEDYSNNNVFFAASNEYEYMVRYSKDNCHKYWYITFLVILLSTLIIVFVFKKITEYRNLKVITKKNQLMELQLKAIQNQLDPHFTLNLFQSFTNLLSENDKERAESLFNKYAVLLKAAVINSNRLFIPLEEELEFIDSYLKLEQFRQQNHFQYNISISPKIDVKVQVPRMLLHIFIENAIKHGLKHLEATGKLDVEANLEDKNIVIEIRDNGIGRQKASEIDKFSTGMGLKIMTQILELYYQLHKKRIRFNITDIMSGGISRGTQVSISIPI